LIELHFTDELKHGGDSESMKALKLSIIIATLLPGYPALSQDCQVQSGDSMISILQSLERAGTAESQFQLGRHYEYGICVEQDDATAIDWYKKAGTKGNTKANYRLGVLFENGWGADVDEERAVTFYTSAATQNHALAQYDLALMYFWGSGVEQNFIAAYKWLLIAIINGNELMQEQLKRVENSMTEDEIVIARSLAREWISQQRESDPDQSG